MLHLVLRAAVLALLAGMLGACADAPAVRHAPAISDEQLLGFDVFPRPSQGTLRTGAETYSVSADMGRFLADIDTGFDERTFDDLIDAMDTFDIRHLAYDTTTLTASEAFEQRRGNCLTFTNMFLVMARRLGLRAQFQEVDIPPDWNQRGSTMVLRRHINVRVLLRGRTAEGMGVRIVDFGEETTPLHYIDLSSRVISDARALAHFFNNWAAESLEAGNDNLAFAYLRKALLEGDSEFAPAWTLAGVMYQRAGRDDLAEQSWLRAAEADPRATAALSNLQRLYARQGRTVLADHYGERVNRHRLRNPYERVVRARSAYAERDYATAIDELQKAIRLRADDSTFYFLLADVYRDSGDHAKAERYRSHGAAVEAQIASTRQYRHDSGDWRLVKPKALPE